MITWGRMVVITALALGVGFAGGIWFIGSGASFRLIGGPTTHSTAASRPPVRGGNRAAQATSRGSSGDDFWLRAQRTDLQPSVDCEWVIEPSPLDLMSEWLSYRQMPGPHPLATREWMAAKPERGLSGQPRFDPASHGLRYSLVEFTTRGKRALDLRPVYFDRAGRRYPLSLTDQSRTPNANDEVVASEFTLDPAEPTQVPPEEFLYFGIERIVPDAEWQAAERAQKAAKDRGIAILPTARPGEPYQFDLTTVEGTRLRSEDFPGKAVLIGVWDSPVDGSMFARSFAELRKVYKDDEIILVGIAIDDSMAVVQAALRKSQTECALVSIPNDPTVRNLWREGARISRLPFYFLVDRDGILRYTSPFHPRPDIFHIKESVDTIFGRNLRIHPLKAKVGPPRVEPPVRAWGQPRQAAAPPS